MTLAAGYTCFELESIEGGEVFFLTELHHTLILVGGLV